MAEFTRRDVIITEKTSELISIGHYCPRACLGSGGGHCIGLPKESSVGDKRDVTVVFPYASDTLPAISVTRYYLTAIPETCPFEFGKK